jgi:superfamily II DNA or RNA helicase
MFLNINNMRQTKYSSYQKIYKEAVKENIVRNKWIADMAKRFHDSGKLPLILVKHKDHGRLLSDLIEGSLFVHGECSAKARKEHLDNMRDRKCGVTIATSIFDEGVDIKPLDALILAGSGKSPTRALQRIGRVLRKSPGKNSALVVDFNDDCKYLKDHSKKRRKIYETEKSFTIKEMDIANGSRKS